MAKIGRPSKYSPEIIATIIARISEGEGLRAICRDDAIPSLGTVMRWLNEHRDFQEQYTLAMEKRADIIFEEIIEIADDGSNDWMEKQNKDGSTSTVLDHEHVQRSKLRCDARYWMLARMKPKKYGEKTAIEHSGKIETDSHVVSECSELAGLLGKKPVERNSTDDADSKPPVVH